MKILFDHNVPKRLRSPLLGHVVDTARERGWERLKNGDLLRSAAGDGYDAFVTLDKRLEHEQNLESLPLAVLVIDCVSSALPDVLTFAPYLLELLKSPLQSSLYVLDARGNVLRLNSPRK